LLILDLGAQTVVAADFAAHFLEQSPGLLCRTLGFVDAAIGGSSFHFEV